MAIFEKETGNNNQYLAILDSAGNMIGIFNPSNKKTPLEVFADAFTEKGINCELKIANEPIVKITL